MKYKIDFINTSYRRFYQLHKREILGAFNKCASNGDFMLREETRDFEKWLAKFVGTKYAVGVNSGTDAIFLSLKALGVGPGDEVITVAHTFIATIQSIIHTGATPILVDVNEEELMDVNQVKKKITKKTKAIVPVHFHGKVCEMNELLKLGIPIVEDAAQALGASYHEKKAGSMGATGCFSFNFPKLMGAYGDAGAITTNNEKLYKKLLLLRNHWNITQGSVRQEDYPQPNEMGWGFKSRIDNIQAAILLVKAKYLTNMLKRRYKIAQMYNEAFEYDPIHTPFFMDTDVVQEYIIQVEDNKDFKKFMDKQGIEVLVRDTTPNHKLKGLGLSKYKLPMTESLAKGCVRLPCYPEMTDQEVKMVINAVKQYHA